VLGASMMDGKSRLMLALPTPGVMVLMVTLVVR
jgi:hypothetical protein